MSNQIELGLSVVDSLCKQVPSFRNEASCKFLWSFKQDNRTFVSSQHTTKIVSFTIWIGADQCLHSYSCHSVLGFVQLDIDMMLIIS